MGGGGSPVRPSGQRPSGRARPATRDPLGGSAQTPRFTAASVLKPRCGLRKISRHGSTKACTRKLFFWVGAAPARINGGSRLEVSQERRETGSPRRARERDSTTDLSRREPPGRGVQPVSSPKWARRFRIGKVPTGFRALSHQRTPGAMVGSVSSRGPLRGLRATKKDQGPARRESGPGLARHDSTPGGQQPKTAPPLTGCARPGRSLWMVGRWLSLFSRRNRGHAIAGSRSHGRDRRKVTSS